MTTSPANSTPAASPTARPGMGTILIPGGVAFRVWAPFATEVLAAGEFNQWSTTANPFASEGNGYWSVEVLGAKIGDEYQFVLRRDLGPLMWRKNPYASAVVNSSGNAIIHDPTFDWTDDNFAMPPWNELVIYEIHVGTFNDPLGQVPGTFDQTTVKLPYLRDLGVNAIEIMPVAEYAMDYSWGYNPAQPFSVESALGGPQGLYKFVKAAHAHGIAVLLDVVYNHFGPGDLDLWRFDGWFNADNDGGIYFYDTARVHTPWGDDRPDYGRGEVRQYIRDNALFWLNKYRIDGLRFDSVVNIRNQAGQNNDPWGDLPDGWGLLQWINSEIHASQPWKVTIAEDLQDNEWITKETAVGGAGFCTQWDAGFGHRIRHAITTANDGDRDMLAIRDALYHCYNGNALQRVIYTESHDGAAMVFTAPGIPMIFQGQEFLEDGYFQDTVPLDWSRLQAFSGIHLLYRDMIRLRRNWFDETRGLRGLHIHVHHINNTDKVVAFHRWDNGGPGDDVVVVANFANRSYESYTIGMPRAGQWRVRLNSDWRGYSADFGNHLGCDTTAGGGAVDNMPYQANVGIGPYSVLILSQDIPR
jgi:1,4-alpha-glucan branching enzyme